MRILNGSELAGFIKERQAKAVRGLRQANRVVPRLAIVRTNSDPVVDVFMRLKQGYGRDINVEVEVFNVVASEAVSTIKQLNANPEVHGIIVQLPIPDPKLTDEILNSVAPEKDVDGLSATSAFDPATPTAIYWLLSGYNIELQGKKIVIVGQGRLVGAPLAKMWQAAGYDVEVIAESVADKKDTTLAADVLVVATGQPAIIKPDMIKKGAVVVDAGVASDNNKLSGDLDDAVRERDDLIVTPKRGGVGPLTICALFENVIIAARKTGDQTTK